MFYLKFDEKELKSKSDHTSNDRNKLLCENVVVVEGKWVAGMNLTDGSIFPMAMIKRAKYRINQNNNLLYDRKQRIRKIALNIGWNK